MNVNQYAEKVVNDFITDITDYVFLAIEHDDVAMREYLDVTSKSGKDEVNQTIGKKVKELLNLENDGETTKCKSSLIESYTRHKIS